MVGRGAAYADYDRDGDLDVIVTANGGAPRLLRNDGNRNHWLRVRTMGTKSNRDGIGARVTVTSPAGKGWQVVKTGSSYCSQSELPLTFGLGSATRVSRVEVTWPSGVVDVLTDVAADQQVTVQEGRGLLK
jgi:enediyne biosynthesis protein E4